MAAFLSSLGPHAGFIIAAYAIFFAVIFGLITWVIQDGLVQRRALADLEARGIRRRSDVVSDVSAEPEAVNSEGIA